MASISPNGHPIIHQSMPSIRIFHPIRQSNHAPIHSSVRAILYRTGHPSIGPSVQPTSYPSSRPCIHAHPSESVNAFIRLTINLPSNHPSIQSSVNPIHRPFSPVPLSMAHAIIYPSNLPCIYPNRLSSGHQAIQSSIHPSYRLSICQFMHDADHPSMHSPVKSQSIPPFIGSIHSPSFHSSIHT